jgi:haloalkane dehalogenase
MDILRTPDERFEDLAEFPFQPHYLEIPSGDGGALRIHYLDEGPPDVSPVLLLHGEPSWSYLYRKMVPPLASAGHRVIVPDLVGFGRSDKPARPEDYSYQRLVEWTMAAIEGLDLKHVTLFCQDWGGLIALRTLAEHGWRFDRIAVANTGLPIGGELPEAFFQWRRFAQKVSKFPVGRIINGGTVTPLSKAVLAGYEAPFPDESYKAGARVLPSLVPIEESDPEASTNRKAWRVLMKWPKPLLTLFSDSDPITQGGEKPFQRLVPGAKGQAHKTIAGAGHFLQEDKGEELAQALLEFIEATA